MNFNKDETRAEAVQKLESIEQISTRSVGTIQQNIMIYNMHKEKTKEKN